MGKVSFLLFFSGGLQFFRFRQLTGPIRPFGDNIMPSLLIVDDDRGIIRIFQRCFEHSDITVLSATSGAEAVRVTSELHPDVVVLDILLPDESGLAACEEIRRLNPTIPIVFITASRTCDTAIESMRLGAMDYLSKPLDMAKIREVIGHAVGISKLIQETAANGEAASADTASSPATSSAETMIGQLPGHARGLQGDWPGRRSEHQRAHPGGERDGERTYRAGDSSAQSVGPERSSWP